MLSKINAKIEKLEKEKAELMEKSWIEILEVCKNKFEYKQNQLKIIRDCDRKYKSLISKIEKEKEKKNELLNIEIIKDVSEIIDLETFRRLVKEEIKRSKK